MSYYHHHSSLPPRIEAAFKYLRLSDEIELGQPMPRHLEDEAKRGLSPIEAEVRESALRALHEYFLEPGFGKTVSNDGESSPFIF